MAVLAALASAASLKALEGLPDGIWPGPRVELTLKENGGERCAGFLLSLQGERLHLRPLDGSPDRELAAGAVESMRFLPPPPEKSASAAPVPAAQEKKPGAVAEPETERPAGREMGPLEFKLKRAKEKWKEFGLAELTSLSKLNEAEREQFKELAFKNPKLLTPAETTELRELRQKMGLPDLSVYRRALEDVRKAAQDGKWEAFGEYQRRGMLQAQQLETCRQHAVALMCWLRAHEPGPPLELFQKMDQAVDRIANESVRERMKSGLRDLVGDFHLQNLRRDYLEREGLGPARPPKPMKE